MEDRNIIEHLLARHPHFIEWLGLLTGELFVVAALQYAVIDKWRSKFGGDLDGMYGRLMTETASWNARYQASVPTVSKDELGEAMKLYTLMVIDVRLPRPTSPADHQARAPDERRPRARAPSPRPPIAEAIMTTPAI
ncbi:hypothetical protein U8Q06_09665 [Rhizobium beringeri]|uniref:Uncharacterized protein n=1 Tax=Rhizobium ruizarguesonis TaxID=2081791 RepID=A0AB38I6K4_9HYPH|nr:MULTISPECIES: hypothetical protein [Rhizobium]TBB66148.1 hypothetical protein ELH42_08215 [Rhizobium ruizarguesonis]TBB70539.1 hypothetical protein ELH45_08265 [Rhizobium ruizarguesonis]TBC15621.1 hypothetical protein ELH40_12125 [Rhizobium ruizarguesonis]WSG90676.1 hypothetical protein U8P73_09550 [Rhizobium beringeri]WSH52848.1 hypothetical protein U8Q06_09665 [Rhizobium beringeri]